jgi:hypothetical protein
MPAPNASSLIVGAVYTSEMGRVAEGRSRSLPAVLDGQQLLVQEDRIEEALKVLKHLEERR